MKVYKRTTGVSTTDIVGRLLLLTKEHHIKRSKMRKLSMSDEDDELSLRKLKEQPKEIKTSNRYAIYTTSRIKNFSKGNR